MAQILRTPETNHEDTKKENSEPQRRGGHGEKHPQISQMAQILRTPETNHEDTKKENSEVRTEEIGRV